MIFMCIQPRCTAKKTRRFRDGTAGNGQWMAGFAMKSHYFCTGERAAMTRKLYPACDAVGTITLNGSVGESILRQWRWQHALGTKLVWFQPVIQHMSKILHLEEIGIRIKNFRTGHRWFCRCVKRELTIRLSAWSVKTGRLTEATHQVLEVIAGHQMILATSHLSHEETFALVKGGERTPGRAYYYYTCGLPNHILYGGRTIRTAALRCLYGTLFCYIQFWKSRL